ncbi:hypothetical protein R3P38DRAFT_3270164 [Favolaschia claudopus]|uniref:Uncharacterized protein n=1 Tax=Favolaschia claudopus TaxID=2862362 RepID=A0AAW0BDJ1_9AGAR
MSAMLFEMTDVDMHPPWFDAEAKMEDDIPHFTDHDSTLSVEVEMDDNYQDIEYEMGDGEGEEYYDEMSSDLLDIQVHEPVDTPFEDATLLPPETVNTSDPPLFGVADPSKLPPLPADLSLMSPLPPDTDLPDAEPEQVEGTDESPGGENASDPPLDPVAASPADDGPLETPAELQQEPQQELLDTVAEQQPEIEAVADAYPEEQLQEQLQKTDVEQVLLESFDERQPSEPGAVVDESGAVEEPQFEDDPSGSDARQADESNAGDPHEISEGVYIDPPPAVLVSFESSDVPDVCLFNQPARSRSASPPAETREQAHQVFDILLHNRPLLYYEPLSSVFEALRQEEFIGRIPHLAESELVLDAYDLQLVISEDNVHAPEVTLHDLNVLHDGCDIAGPLRFRLKAVAPRFILRYHSLQDQVSRLNLANQENSTSTREQAQTVQEDLDKEPNDNSAPKDPQVDTSAAEETLPEHDTEYIAPEPESTPQQIFDEASEANVVEEDGEGYTGSGQVQTELDEINTASLPPLPEEDDDEEEPDATGTEESKLDDEFVVIETPGTQPSVTLTGILVEGTGNERETDPQSSLDPSSRDDAGPSEHEQEDELQSGLVPEDDTGVLANNSAEPSTEELALDGEIYDDDSRWEDTLEGDGDPDTTWEVEEPENETASNESSVTLSSKASKRSFDQIDPEEVVGQSPPGSPGSKRTRIA